MDKARDDWLKATYGSWRESERIDLAVLSGSMAPCLPVGSTIRVKCTAEMKTRIGDIIVYKEGGRLTAHRQLLWIVFGRRGYVFQKGDNSKSGKWIRAEQIIGIVEESRNDKEEALYVRRLSIKQDRKKAIRMIVRTAVNEPLKFPRWIKRLLLQ